MFVVRIVEGLAILSPYVLNSIFHLTWGLSLVSRSVYTISMILKPTLRDWDEVFPFFLFLNILISLFIFILFLSSTFWLVMSSITFIIIYSQFFFVS